METSDLQHQATASTHLLEEVFARSNMLTMPPPPPPQSQQQQEKLPRPQPEQALRCPRCDSTNTKFCYYNNYSLSQPRYFCKGCRRYWTKGGTLRNVPVGGGCRKNKRPSSSKKGAHDPHSLAAANAVLQSLPPPPPLTYDPNDLTLAFAGLQKPPVRQSLCDSSLSQHILSKDRERKPMESHLLGLDDDREDPFSAAANAIPPQVPGFLDILRSGFLDGSAAGLYYGLGGQGAPAQEAEGGVGGEQQVVAPPPFEGLGGATVAAIKQENSYRSVGDVDSKLFMGLQWQVGGDGGNVSDHMVVDPGRDYYYWNGVGSSWHGLVHSSLI